MDTLLYLADAERGRHWREVFTRESRAVVFRSADEDGDDGDVRFIVCWDVPADCFTRYPRLEAIFCLGAGVDHIDLAGIPEHVRVVRMVEPGVTAGMTEYVVMSVLMAHRNAIEYVAQQRQQLWQPRPMRTAASCTVGIMGAGVLGLACIEALRPFGFRLRLWSRTQKRVDGATSFAAAELDEFLAGCEVLVCLLPATGSTRHLLNAAVFNALPRGAYVINVSRGSNLHQGDLLQALRADRLSGAILDVADPEPLTTDDPLWSDPRIFITPHIACRTQPISAARVVLSQIDRHRRGAGFDHVVDRRRGY